jgi:hypothetical protein
MSYSHDLVIEFQDVDPAKLERLLALEASLGEALPHDFVDGYETGLGILNLYLNSNDPQRCFKDVLRVLEGSEYPPAAAGYRQIRHEHYVRLWPPGDPTPFVLSLSP